MPTGDQLLEGIAMNTELPNDEIAHWAQLEGKSDSATYDLQKDTRAQSAEQEEQVRSVLGGFIVAAIFALFAWSAYSSWSVVENGTDDHSPALAQQEFHFRP